MDEILECTWRKRRSKWAINTWKRRSASSERHVHPVTSRGWVRWRPGKIQCSADVVMLTKGDYVPPYDPATPRSACVFALSHVQKNVHNRLICISQTLGKSISPFFKGLGKWKIRFLQRQKWFKHFTGSTSQSQQQRIRIRGHVRVISFMFLTNTTSSPPKGGWLPLGRWVVANVKRNLKVLVMCFLWGVVYTSCS